MPPPEVRLGGTYGLEVVSSGEASDRLIRRLRGAEPPVKVRRAGPVLRIPFADGRRLAELAPQLRWQPEASRALASREAVAEAAPTVIEHAHDIVRRGPAAAAS